MGSWRLIRPLLLAAVLGAVLVGCSSKTATGPATPTTNVPTVAGASPPPPPSAGPSASTSPAGAPQNLVVTDALRADLLKAGAASHQLPVFDYTGLAPGMTYYALDPATGISWAGAALVPGPGSIPAQVANQDDGAYLLFEKMPGGQWVANDDGYGALPGSGCPAPLPASVIALWQWDAATCHPRT